MITAFIANKAVPLPNRFEAGMLMTESNASVLEAIRIKRLASKLRWMMDHGQIDAQGAQAKALELAQEELAPYNIAEDGDIDDPILMEAMEMARSLITARMAAEGLPPPKGLDQHAKALVDAMPALIEKARMRVEARYQASALPLI